MFRTAVIFSLCLALCAGLMTPPMTASERVATTQSHGVDLCCAADLTGAPRLCLDSPEGNAKLMLAQQSCSPLAPLELGGPPANDDDVRNAIITGVNYILNLQAENGSWDVELTGSFLSGTADEAMDAVLVSALCGLALQPHTAVNPDRITKACDRATEFICDRVLRGKLPKNIYYSVWRYAWGLKFLNYQYAQTADEALKEKIRNTSEMMIKALFEIQLVGEGTNADDRRRLERIQMRKGKLPSIFGVTLKDPDPTVSAGKEGAVVDSIIPGGSVEGSDLKVGDHILSVNGEPLKTRFQFYDWQLEYLSGDKIKLKVLRDGVESDVVVTMKETWPGYLGITYQAGSDGIGVEVTGHMLRSPFKEELQVGDQIIEVNGEALASKEQFDQLCNSTLAGDKLKVKTVRKGSKKTLTLRLPPSPGGSLGILIQEEDKSDADGVPVGAVRKGSAGETMKLTTSDRITYVDGKSVKGLDQYLNLESTLPAGKIVKVTVLRGGTQEEEMDVRLGPLLLPADMGIEPRGDADWNDPVIIGAVTRNGAAEHFKMKPGDKIVAINKKTIPSWQAYTNIIREFHAWQEVTVTVDRKGSTTDVPFIMGEVDIEAGGPEETGGWAYYPDMGIAASFCTATTIIVLDEVRRDMKLPFDAFRMKRLAMSANLLKGFRVAKGGYKYHKYSDGNVLGSQGRSVVCEYAMVLAGRQSKGDLGEVMKIWLDHREELDRVREFEGTHCYDHYANAAYYWLFSHYYVMAASNRLLGSGANKVMGATVIKALMQTREEDGTWLMSHKAFGPLVGTCLAMMTLGESEGKFREGYPTPEQATSGQ